MKKLLDIIPPRRIVVVLSGCWEYQGRKNKAGRPAEKVFGMALFRFLVALRLGPPPSPKHHAAHTCHNRVCVNPEHGEWQLPEENNPRKFSSELHEIDGINVIVKKRRTNKGDGRTLLGWCAVFRHGGKSYKSGAYYSKEAALRWAAGKFKELNNSTT